MATDSTILDDILKVLESLQEGAQPNRVSDILFGDSLHPAPNSTEDLRIREVERSLLTDGLVDVVSAGEINRTISGYFYFTISSKGKSELIEMQSRHFEVVRPLNALSTSEIDVSLISQGLTNRGLLGYIDYEKKLNTIALHSYNLTFKDGQDFFYTTNSAKERFEGLTPINNGIIGYVTETSSPNSILLQRFFNKAKHYHLFATNPTLETKTSGYRNESDDNPIYLHRTYVSGSLPLYLYSNSNRRLFHSTNDNRIKSLSEWSNQDGKNFAEIIDKTRFRTSAFSILERDDNSYTISINQTPLKFHIKHTDRKYSIVVLDPTIPNSARAEPNLEWREVLKHFESWLLSLRKALIKEESHDTTSTLEESENKNVAELLYIQNPFTIRDAHEIEPVLGVSSLAEEIADVLNNIHSEPGNMTGIFGPWGRGKTFLMNRIWQKLQENSQKINYLKVSYQAWRYQDTPANWAYLYERFSEDYLGNKRSGPKGFIKYHLRLWDLNIERNGSWGLILGCSIAGVLAIASLFIPVIAPNTIWGYLRVILAPTLYLLIQTSISNFRLDHFSKAINLVRKYGIKTSFRTSLGLQAEIQKELNYLINAWIKGEAKTTKGKHKINKIVLFVDDLDRCNEHKVIEIIDALRVILDDEKVKNKLLVITAIDERILQSAIQQKYNVNKNEIDQKILVREYIDKLFIFSVKLGPLTIPESQEFFDALVKGEKAMEGSPIKTSSVDFTPTIAAKNINTSKIESISMPKSESTFQHDTEQPKIEKYKGLTIEEIATLKQNLGEMINPTPRSIRILYYRYLLAKNILIRKHSTDRENCYWLKNKNQNDFVKLLIQFSQTDTNEINKKRELTIAASEPTLNIDANNPEIKVNKIEYLNLLKILEVVIAY